VGSAENPAGERSTYLVQKSRQYYSRRPGNVHQGPEIPDFEPGSLEKLAELARTESDADRVRHQPEALQKPLGE
jgi:hypothetical protein